ADSAGKTSRPDRAHYVIDIVPDVIRAVPDNGDPPYDVEVVQVWVDPDYPDAHRDPALRAFLEHEKTAAIVRYDSRRAFTLIPPSRSNDGKWIELESTITERAHHFAHPDTWQRTR